MKLGDATHGLTGSDLEKVRLQGESLVELGAFWDQSARVDALRAIADRTDEVSFETSGTQEAKVLLELAPADPIVLEVGCGIGRIMRHLAPGCAEVHGIDISSEMVERGARRLADLPNVHFHHGNGYDLAEFGDETFDLVYSTVVFQHIPKTVAYNYLTEVRRVLKPGGLLRLQVPNLLRPDHFSAFRHFSQPYFVQHPYPMNFYTPAEVAVMMSNAGLAIQSIDDYVVVVARRGEAGEVHASMEDMSLGLPEMTAIREQIARQQQEIAQLQRICDHWSVRTLRAAWRLARWRPRQSTASSRQPTS